MSEVRHTLSEESSGDYKEVRAVYDPLTGRAELYGQVPISENDYLESRGIDPKVTEDWERLHREVVSNQRHAVLMETIATLRTEVAGLKEENEGLKQDYQNLQNNLPDIIKAAVRDALAEAPKPAPEVQAAAAGTEGVIVESEHDEPDAPEVVRVEQEVVDTPVSPVEETVVREEVPAGAVGVSHAEAAARRADERVAAEEAAEQAASSSATRIVTHERVDPVVADFDDPGARGAAQESRGGDGPAVRPVPPAQVQRNRWNVFSRTRDNLSAPTYPASAVRYDTSGRRSIVTEDNEVVYLPERSNGTGRIAAIGAMIFSAAALGVGIYNAVETEQNEHTINKIAAIEKAEHSTQPTYGAIIVPPSASESAPGVQGIHTNFYDQQNPKHRLTGVELSKTLHLTGKPGSERLVDNKGNVIVKKVMWTKKGVIVPSIVSNLRSRGYTVSYGKLGGRYKSIVLEKQ